MDSRSWLYSVLDAPSPGAAWQTAFDQLAELATGKLSPIEMHAATVAPDRILAESAWELWQCYALEASRTSEALRQWWALPSSYGRAVLILDALSLRELPALMEGAANHGVTPASVRVTGSEVPSDTNQFAAALGASSRGDLANGKASSSFAFHTGGVYTDVVSLPFEDCAVSHDTNLFLWHTFLDDLIHLQKRAPEQVAKATWGNLTGDGFWTLVAALRQGRSLVITGDHGYAAAQLFSSEVRDPEMVARLRTTFGASRSAPAIGPWDNATMPPLVVTEAGHHVVMGQRKWAAPGGFPRLCHGGLSLLEVAVPFVEFAPI